MSSRQASTPMEHFEQVCRARGIPLTVHRRAILEAMLGREDHPTADQLHAEISIRLPGISRTSVYRILDVLVNTGMINKVCHPGSAARFDPKLRRHHHLVCLSCERLIDIEEPRLDRLPLPDVRAMGFQINDYHIHFRGICAECARKQTSPVPASRPVGRPRAGSKIKASKPKRKK